MNIAVANSSPPLVCHGRLGIGPVAAVALRDLPRAVTWWPKRRSFVGLLLALWAFPAAAQPVGKSPGPAEANIQTALSWWAPPRGVWTPIGWRDHLFRFQVVYNGSVLCTPAGWLGKPHTEKYRGQDFQLDFTPSVDGSVAALPREPMKLYKIDGGLGVQGWREDLETPVLWTEWPCQEGVVLRQEVFAHMKSGAEVVIGTEPLFAWVRLSIAHVDPLRAPARFSFGIRLSRAYYDVAGTLDDSVFFLVRPDKCRLTERLVPHEIKADEGKSTGLRLEQAGGKVRLVVVPGGAGAWAFTESGTNTGIYHLRIELPARPGAHTDVLVPMLPESAEEASAEAALGFTGALAECEAYWKVRPSTAARIQTPEKYINHALARNLQFAQIIAERNPDTGEYSFLSGSYGYDTLWSTPSSMISHMFLDLLGYHQTVEQHVQLYKAHQGTVRPPGSGFSQHPGYLSTPKNLTAIDWLSDHGAILEILSRHALLTGDRRFIDGWLEPILKACDFIKDSCAATNHLGVKGVMPPAVATDSGVPSQAVWNQAWTFKGLSTSVALLKRIGHPRAGEFERLAADFKSRFQSAFLAETAKAPRWTAPDGRQYPILATALIPPPTHHVYDDAFLLDTGPLCLPWAGLFDARDPLMRSFADFFRVGPNHRLRGPQTGAISRAVLIHELASCECCYSWNIVNSWHTGDRPRFLEGMYSLFAGGISPQTFINCEHRHAMYGNVFVAPLMTWCLRQAVVDDQLAPGELHLLRLCPLAWLSAKEETLFEQMPTIYGPVSLRWKLAKGERRLDLDFTGAWREAPRKIVLHPPPAPRLEQIRVNGRGYSVKRPIMLKVEGRLEP